MAKDFVSSLGAGELNALMSMQVMKLGDTTKRLVKLFEDNDHADFTRAYEKSACSEGFMQSRDALIDEIRNVIDTMDKIRVAQSGK